MCHDTALLFLFYLSTPEPTLLGETFSSLSAATHSISTNCHSLIFHCHHCYPLRCPYSMHSPVQFYRRPRFMIYDVHCTTYITSYIPRSYYSLVIILCTRSMTFTSHLGTYCIHSFHITDVTMFSHIVLYASYTPISHPSGVPMTRYKKKTIGVVYDMLNIP